MHVQTAMAPATGTGLLWPARSGVGGDAGPESCWVRAGSGGEVWALGSWACPVLERTAWVPGRLGSLAYTGGLRPRCWRVPRASSVGATAVINDCVR